MGNRLDIGCAAPPLRSPVVADEIPPIFIFIFTAISISIRNQFEAQIDDEPCHRIVKIIDYQRTDRPNKPHKRRCSVAASATDRRSRPWPMMARVRCRVKTFRRPHWANRARQRQIKQKIIFSHRFKQPLRDSRPLLRPQRDVLL